jgi:hypothetical protein
LQLSANENIKNVTVYTVLGKKIKQIANDSLETTIDMSNLLNGVYFIKAEVGNVVGTFKMFKKQ